MNFYAASALINFFTSLSLGGFVFLKNKKGIVNIAFSLFSSSVAFWSFGYFFWQISNNAEMALFWSRVLMAGAVFIPVTYFHFVIVLVELFNKRKKFLVFSYFLFFLFFLFDFTPFFVNRVEHIFSYRFWPLPGPVYHIFLVVWFGYVIYSTYLLFNKYKISQGIVRSQIKYVFLGMVVGFAGGSTNYFLWYKIPVPPIANILVSVYVAAIAYSIVKYRLMDLRIVARRFFIYFGVTAFTYGMFYLVAWIYSRFLGGVFTPTGYLAGLVIAPVFVAAFYGVNKSLKIIANKYFFVSLYNYQSTINKLSEELNYLTDLNQIIDLIVDTIKQTMQLDRAGLLLINQNKQPVQYQIAKVVGFNRQNGISLVQDNFLTKHLKKTQKPLVRDELILLARDANAQKETEGFTRLHNHMKHIEASLCLPLMSSNQLIGIIVLGSKISGDAYTKEDLELLNTLAYQAGIAIDNARLYKEVQDFNKTLKQKVDEQTVDLKEQAEHLKKLLQMRSEFLDIASHQLKTPVSVILGTTSMFKEGSIQKLPQQQQAKFIDNIFYKAKKLSTIINDILRASEMDTDQFELVKENIKPSKPEDILQSVYDELKPEAEQKGLQFSFHKPKKAVGVIMADADFLEQAVYNLVDNAIKYTAEGFVKIVLSREENKIIIKIADSGIGIPETDQKKMFDKFARAKNAVNMYTDGSGLGLFIVKKIVEAHNDGHITFSSEENKGTIFTISLPVYKRVPSPNSERDRVR
ncbi:MAG: GAF domain-containing protein [Candidatus Magasanikbacteria bacterium]|nr:GAF domain-containing protein [Candidatus Magasanikbacteria bacterium]